MDENILGTFHPVLLGIYMFSYLPNDVKFPTNPNDNHSNLHLFRNILEFLSIRIQMCSYLQNNNNKLLYSCTILRNYRTYLLDYCTWNV